VTELTASHLFYVFPRHDDFVRRERKRSNLYLNRQLLFTLLHTSPNSDYFLLLFYIYSAVLVVIQGKFTKLIKLGLLEMSTSFQILRSYITDFKYKSPINFHFNACTINKHKNITYNLYIHIYICIYICTCTRCTFIRKNTNNFMKYNSKVYIPQSFSKYLMLQDRKS